MTLDEKLYAILNRDSNRVEALGVPMLDRPNYLVGLYFGINYRENPEKDLVDIGNTFGEAMFISVKHNRFQGLVCKMSVPFPDLYCVCSETDKDHFIQDSILKMRDDNPKPILALYYNSKNKFWDYKAVPWLSSLNSKFSYVPN